MDSDTVAWDQAEPEDLLFWVQRALHRYVENPACEECLGLAREGLDRLRPGLEAAGQHDAIPLCEELLRLATALDEGRLQWSPEVSALVARAAQWLSGTPDSAESMLPDGLPLPLVNELRALRGVGPLMMPAIVMASAAQRPAAAASQRAGSVERKGRAERPRATPAQSGAAAGERVSRPADLPAEAPVRKPERGSTPPMETEQRPPEEDRAAESSVRVSRGSPAPLLSYDRDLLDRAVLAPHLDRAPPRLPEVLATAVRGLTKAFAQWRAEGAAAEAARALSDRLRILRTMARPVALRFGEFAGIVESVLIALADRGRPVGREAQQLIGDAIDVMPLLLDEVRAGGPADTPLADILLRAESLLAAPPAGAAEEESRPLDEEMPGLERIRSRGQAEMARLAAAFDALDGGAGSSASEHAGSSGSGASAGSVDLRAPQEQVAQLVDWQHRVVDALTRIAAQAQALEAVIGLLNSAGADAFSSSDRAGEGFRTPDAVEELKQLQKALGVAVGDASAAVLRQQRLTRVLQDSLQGRGPERASRT